jgi:hypothetical protein
MKSLLGEGFVCVTTNGLQWQVAIICVHNFKLFHKLHDVLLLIFKGSNGALQDSFKIYTNK